MGGDPSKTVLNSDGEYRGLKNLLLMDGAIFSMEQASILWFRLWDFRRV